MADRATIQAAPRSVLGKKVKLLRLQGILPANVYGRGIESTPVQVDGREFLRTIKASGLRGMFELAIEGEKSARHVILRQVERRGGTGEPIHVDFFQVDPNKPIQAGVPIHLTGIAPAVRDLAGVLIQVLDQVTVRTKPLDIPQSLEIDVSSLTSFDVSLTVADLDVPEGVEILTDSALAIATVNPPRLLLEEEEEEEEAAAEAAEGEEEAGEEGAAEESAGDNE